MQKQNYNFDQRTRTTGQLGMCTPVFFQEVVPNGDYILSPRLKIDFAPFSDRFYGDIEFRLRFFEVDFSYVWDEWDSFFIKKENVLMPYKAHTQDGTNEMLSYYMPFSLALADLDPNPALTSAIPYRMYEALRPFYRSSYGDSDLYEKTFATTSGEDTTTPCTIIMDEFDPDDTTRLQPTQLPASIPNVASAPFTAAQLKTMLQTTKVHDAWRALISRKPEEFYQLMFGRSKRDNSFPQEIASFKGRISVNEIVATATTEDTSLGQSTGLAFASMDGKPFVYKSDSFGCIVGILSVMPESNFINGYHDVMVRRTQEEFLQQQLVNIGLTVGKYRFEIEKRNDTPDQEVLGYAPVFNRYRMPHNFLAGGVIRSQNKQIIARRVEEVGTPWTPLALATPTINEFNYLFQTDEDHFRIGMVTKCSFDLPLPLALPGKFKIEE